MYLDSIYRIFLSHICPSLLLLKRFFIGNAHSQTKPKKCQPWIYVNPLGRPAVFHWGTKFQYHKKITTKLGEPLKTNKPPWKKPRIQTDPPDWDESQDTSPLRAYLKPGEKKRQRMVPVVQLLDPQVPLCLRTSRKSTKRIGGVVQSYATNKYQFCLPFEN